MSKVKTYFDSNSHNHIYHNEPLIYTTIIEQILKHRNVKQLKVLDVGCGDGSFLKGLLDYRLDALLIGTYISYNMLKSIDSDIYFSKIDLFVADAFELPIRDKFKFDLIHIDSVLHHLISKDRIQSKKLIETLIFRLINKLNKNGILVIEEKYYDSYIIPTFTSSAIFYILKFINKINLDINKIIKEFSKGLEVNFLHEKELVNMLKKYGEPQLIHKRDVKVPYLYKSLLLKSFGHVSYLVKID